MNNIAFIFDGQGSKFNNFGKDFYDNDVEFKKYIDNYKEQFDINSKVYEKDIETNNTELFQPATFLVEMGIVELLKKKNIIANNFAGSSLGEYSAICSAGYIEVEDGIKILQNRGRLMNEALSEIESKMCAVMFLDKDIVSEIAEKNNCEISNVNSYDQVVVSGLTNNVDLTCKECIEKGAKRIIELESQGAFHSKYLKEASEKFGKILNSFEFKNMDLNENNVYYNYTGCKEKVDNSGLYELLTKQLYSKVKLLDIVENMLDDGINIFYEIGPGGNLAFHIKNIARAKGINVQIYKINNYEEYIGVI